MGIRLIDTFNNVVFNRNRYRTHSEAIIISCFWNPQNSPYRLIAFQKFYNSIKHLNHRIIECVIGDSKPQLPDSPYIVRLTSDSLLWHKESLLNALVRVLPDSYKYVFWLDADIRFSNLDWMPQSVELMEKGINILQPYEYCVHLERNQTNPTFNVEAAAKNFKFDPARKMWRSFCANYGTPEGNSREYNTHGHVGFAWGARREILRQMPLYDRALIGGADHIMAHAAAGQVPHECIIKAFRDDIENVEPWMNDFASLIDGRVGFIPGNVYHYWHGDIGKRQYLQRIKDFTLKSKEIQDRDANGLWVKKDDPYISKYFQQREVPAEDIGYDGFDEGFFEDMGYMLSDLMCQLTPEPNVDYVDSEEFQQNSDPEPYRGAGSDTQEDYPNNEDPDTPVETIINSINNDSWSGAGSDSQEDYPDNESDSSIDETFS